MYYSAQRTMNSQNIKYIHRLFDNSRFENVMYVTQMFVCYDESFKNAEI